ncbi:MAG: hypothetical protein NT133_15450 [Alphaproteobacteria bacterium]|nr:hypothetical protein [Alphaproteobacteria bacterium]
MQFHLVVVRPFGAYAKGTVITDQDVVTEILAGEHAADVVRIAIREG